MTGTVGASTPNDGACSCYNGRICGTCNAWEKAKQ